jgi:hypothetical protein
MSGTYEPLKPPPNVFGAIGEETPTAHPGIASHLFYYDGYLWYNISPWHLFTLAITFLLLLGHGEVIPVAGCFPTTVQIWNLGSAADLVGMKMNLLLQPTPCMFHFAGHRY